MSDAFGALLRREATSASQRENRARLAWSFAAVTTTGSGEAYIADRVDFDVAFMHEPYLFHGYSVDGDTLVAGRYPRAHAFVASWDQDSQGNYVGCWVACVVETEGSQFGVPVDEDPSYEVTHSLSFAGVAAKPIPAHRLR